MNQNEHLSDTAREQIEELEDELARLDHRQSEILDEISRIKENDIPEHI